MEREIMKLPNFSKVKKNTNPTPPWESLLAEGDFISCNTSYVMGGYWDLFDEKFLPCKEKGDIRYFVYNPIKNGSSPEKKYPVMMWIHGFNCSLDGRRCVGYCGAEQYASPKYQSDMGGGAFIIVPLANEKRLEDDSVVDSWDDAYLPYLKQIFDQVLGEHQENISSKFIMGASSGGYISWKMLELFPDFFTGGIPIASGYIPTDEQLDILQKHNINLIIAHGKHDEMASFEKSITPRLEKLESLQNTICFFPDWVRNEDKGVASVNYGMEMGQHCLINQFQANLMFDDGSCFDEKLPSGVTGWIKKVTG